MYILCGKTASGKTTVLNKLISEHGYEGVITYTTRPKRRGEKKEVTYHFITEEEFKQKISEGFFAEWTSYDTVDGVYYYGSAKEDYIDGNKKIIILNPIGVKSIVETIDFSPKILYIYANNSTIKKRLEKRGDKKEESERRIKADNEDFKGIENLASRIFYNNQGKKLDDLVQELVAYMEG